MKDPNLSELIRICIRCWLYLVPQAFLGIHLFSMFMRKKHSMKPLMIWQLLRVILIGGISDIILRGYYGNESWWEILMMFLSVVIMIANTVLFYYSFEGSLPKVVLGGMLADIVTAMIHYPAICIVDLLAGRQLYVLKCPVEPDSCSGISVLPAGEKNNHQGSERISGFRSKISENHLGTCIFPSRHVLCAKWIEGHTGYVSG